MHLTEFNLRGISLDLHTTLFLLFDPVKVPLILDKRLWFANVLLAITLSWTYLQIHWAVFKSSFSGELYIRELSVIFEN